MRRLIVPTVVCLLGALPGVAGATGDFYMSWSDSEYIQTLTVSADTTATCYLLVQDDGVDFVGYMFTMILTGGLAVVAHQPALPHAVGAMTMPDEFTDSPIDVYLEYQDCETLSGLTCVATIDVAINATVVRDGQGTSGLVPYAATYPPSILMSLFPEHCLLLSIDAPFASWSAAIVVAAELPVDASTWGSVKALYSTGE